MGFVCAECIKGRNLTLKNYLLSYGPCEICKETKECYDC